MTTKPSSGSYLLNPFEIQDQIKSFEEWVTKQAEIGQFTLAPAAHIKEIYIWSLTTT